ncbi:MAG: radical SAM protein [Thermoanaerobaculia bacterium]|nr:radical SAM protein [Thermoanaerobaculia bacterium]
MTELAAAARPVPSRAEGALLPAADPVSSLPILTLLPVSRCNCRCAMCDIWKEKNANALSRHDVERLLPDLSRLGTRRVVLSGGEPLMHPDLFGLVRPLREAGMGLTLLSSGLLLERFASEIAATFDDVVVSLDGPGAVHDAIRGVPGAFDRLRRGVAALRGASPGPSLSGRCTVQKENLSRLGETVAAAREVGLDRISFLAADTTSPAFGREAGWAPESRDRVVPDAAGLAALETEIERLEAEHGDALASGFVAESASKLRARLLLHFRACAGEAAFPPSTCNAPWVSAVVETDLSVRPCFFHPAYGRLGEDGLEPVLNGEAALRFRRALDVASDPVCLRCPCRLNLRRGEEEAR